MENKILDTKKLVETIGNLKKSRKKIVTTNGAFDLFHYGHLKALRFAKEKGDILIVGINSDASIKRYKSKDRPIINEKERAAIVAAIGCVDYVTIFDEDTPEELLEIIKPDVHVKGSEYKDNIIEKDVILRNGGKIVFMERSEEDISTSKIIEKIIKNLR